jgi:hypothetical protein
MANAALQAQAGTGTVGVRPYFDRAFDPPTVIIFLGLLGAGLLSNLIPALASVVGRVDERHETHPPGQAQAAIAVLDGFRQPQWSKLPYSAVRR